jgi:sugar phosphate isomerase/epimerase
MAARRALNLITIQRAPLRRQLEVARLAGYDGVGLWVEQTAQVARGSGGLQGIRGLLDENGLVPAELCFVGGWMYPEPGQCEPAHDRARQAFQMAQGLGCECVVACASGGSGDLEDAASDLAGLCALAREFGVKVALEFLGGAQQVKDVATAWRIVDMAGARNGGLLIDTFHFYKGGSQVADLEPIPADCIYLLHVNDCPDMPREELEDRHRSFPGTGIIPLESIAAVVVDKGYRGFFSLELFNEEYWAADPYTVAQEGIRSLKRNGL